MQEGQLGPEIGIVPCPIRVIGGRTLRGEKGVSARGCGLRVEPDFDDWRQRSSSPGSDVVQKRSWAFRDHLGLAAVSRVPSQSMRPARQPPRTHRMHLYRLTRP